MLGLGFDEVLSGEEEDEEARVAQMSSSTNCQVVAWRSSSQRDRRPAQTSETLELDSVFRRTWLDYI